MDSVSRRADHKAKQTSLSSGVGALLRYGEAQGSLPMGRRSWFQARLSSKEVLTTTELRPANAHSSHVEIFFLRERKGSVLLQYLLRTKGSSLCMRLNELQRGVREC